MRTAGLLIWNRELPLAFGTGGKTIGYAVRFMDIYTLGMVLVQPTLWMNAFIIAQGFAKIGMLSVTIGAVNNIVLTPIFIFWLHMGVAGAAWATVILQEISCVWVLSFLLGKTTFLKIRRDNLRLCRKVILPCLALGLAPFIMQASESIIACFNSSLLRYGGDTAALFLFGIQAARQMAFTALDRARASITVAVMRKFVLLISLIYLLPARRTTTVYPAEPAAAAAAMTFTAILFAVQFKKS